MTVATKSNALADSWEVEPCAEPVATAGLLEEIGGMLRRFVAIDEAAFDALALWLLHAWAHSAATISPILALTSPVMRCGKTTLLTLLRFLVPKPLPTANTSLAAVFRIVEEHSPTLLLDEADTYLAENQELRGVLNSGHSRGLAFVTRVEGEKQKNVVTFATWAPKVIAGIGKLPPTLTDRSIVVSMRRRTVGEALERLRHTDTDEFRDTRSKCLRWSEDNVHRLRFHEPDGVDGLDDRAADNWTPLIAIAEHAGGEWPSRARAAASNLSGGREEDSRAIQLLGDIRAAFQAAVRPSFNGADEIEGIATKTLLAELTGDPEKPWAEWSRGKPMTDRALAAVLRPFGIHSGTIRIGEATPKGYKLRSFHDAFARYLAP
jgi:putative DNA primase/helicase